MGTIDTRTNSKGGKTYRARPNPRGVAPSKTFTKRRDAAAWIATKEREHALADEPALRAAGRKVSDVIEYFVEHGLEGRTRIYRRQTAFRLEAWNREIGDLVVGAVAPEHIRAAWKVIAKGIEGRGEKGKKAPPAHNTRIHYLRALKRAFRFALAERYIGTNPIAEMRVGKLRGEREKVPLRRRGCEAARAMPREAQRPAAPSARGACRLHRSSPG